MYTGRKMECMRQDVNENLKQKENSLPDSNVCQNGDYNGCNHSNRHTNNQPLLNRRSIEIFEKPDEAKCLF